VPELSRQPQAEVTPVAIGDYVQRQVGKLSVFGAIDFW
jgi:hypothetical protein